MLDRSFLASLVLSLPLAACVIETSEDTDTDTDGGSTSSTTDSDPSSGTSTSSSSGSVDESSSSDSTTSGSSSSGGADETTTGGETSDICWGYTALGVSSEVGNDGTAMGQPMCTLTPAPCGGDFVGEWTMEATCGYEVLPNYFEEVCAGSTQQVTGSSISGTRTFNDDNTFTFDAIVQLEADLQVDSMACAGVDCVTFGEALSDEPGIEMVCEDGNGTSCNCIYTADIPHVSTGTWNLYNDAILLTSEDGEVIGLQEYCVEGGRFTTWSPLYQGTAFPDTSCAADDDCEGQVVGEFDGIGCDPPEDAG